MDGKSRLADAALLADECDGLHGPAALFANH
jgi:hypothetical protein